MSFRQILVVPGAFVSGSGRACMFPGECEQKWVVFSHNALLCDAFRGDWGLMFTGP